MLGVATAAGWVLVAAGLLGAVFALAAGAAVGRFFAGTPATGNYFPPVTVLKPLYGAEPGLRETLESFFTQEYPAPVQIVFGVGEAEDAAAPIVKALMARHPERDAVLAVTGRHDGTNPKIVNLIGMMPHAKHGILVLSDSDIGVARDYLRLVTAHLAEPSVGLVTCCYVGKPLAGIWSRLVAQGIDYHFLPGVVLGIVLGLARPCFGSTIAISRPVLDEIGGFEVFRDRLADDYEIGNAVHARGYDVALPPFVVTHNCTESSFGELFRHELRWQRTIRSVNPGGFAGSFITHAFPLTLIGGALLEFSAPALAVLGFAILARLILKFRIDRALFRPGTGLWLFPLRDMLSFGVFVAAFFAGRVDWRGSRFRVRDGELARE